MNTVSRDLASITEILEQNLAEITQFLRRREGIAIEKSADQIDEIQYASERDLAIRNADRESRLLRDIRAALRRIQTGEFGLCLECEAPISARRLEALPWASLCIRCQENADLQQSDGSTPEDVLLTAAA